VPFCDCPHELLERYLLKDGDMLFARIGATTGKSFLVKGPPKAVFASYLIRVRVKDGVSSDFVSQFCATREYWRQIEATKGNNLKGGINSSILRRLQVPLPPAKEEQMEIAEAFRPLDDKTMYARMKRAALGDLFRTLLHQLMTAQIRVNDVALPQMEGNRL
jgi:type I restriction enzyme S subunit